MEEYKITFPGWLCLRCGHKWPALNPATPMVCPKCRSPYWKTHKKDAAEKKMKQAISDMDNQMTAAVMYFTDVKPVDLPKLLQKPHIPQKDITPDNQDETQKACFMCAQERKYDCPVKDNYDIGKQSKAENDLCPDCVTQEFWTQKDMFKEIIGVSKEPEIAFTLSEDPNSKDRYTEMAYKCNLKTKYPGGKIICANKDRGRVVNEACPLCWELEEIWGVEAVGYKERRKT